MEIVSSIRSENRNSLMCNIQMKRNLELDRRRLLNTASESSTKIENVANKLKTKTHISQGELARLRNALLTETNINAFMKIHGALRGIIREFTGTDSGKQILAAECLCNLALSDAKSACIISKAAGPYMLPFLHNTLNPELVITCAWTIGNLAGAHKRVCDILIDQGAVQTLIAVLKDSKDDDVEDSIYYALIRLVFSLEDCLQTETCNMLLEVLVKKSRNQSFHHLVFILCCHSEILNCHIASSELLQLLLEDLSKCDINNTDKLNFILKSLANLCVIEQNSNSVLEYWRNENNLKFETVLLNKMNGLHDNMLWLLGNIFTTCNSTMENVQFFHTISEIIVKCTNTTN